jgi:hypothetical protein
MSVYGESFHQPNGLGGDRAMRAEFTPAPNPERETEQTRSTRKRRRHILGGVGAGLALIGGIIAGREVMATDPTPHESVATTTSSSMEKEPEIAMLRDRDGKEIEPADIARMAKIFVQENEPLDSAAKRWFDGLESIANIQARPDYDSKALADTEIMKAASLMYTKAGYNKRVDPSFADEIVRSRETVAAKGDSKTPFDISRIKVNGTGDLAKPDSTEFHGYYIQPLPNSTRGQEKVLVVTLTPVNDPATGKPVWKANGLITADAPNS